VSEREITTLLDRIAPDVEGETGDWEDVLRRGGLDRHERHPLRQWGLALVAAAIAAAGLALGVTAPWQSGPSVLEQAAAAISAPGPGQILEERIVIQSHVRVPGPRIFHVGVWLDGAPPHRYRATLDRPLLDSLGRAEYGGMLGRPGGFSYSATDKALDPQGLAALRQADLDPAAFIRDAITSGRAKVEGTSTLHGRRVRQILLTSESSAGLARYLVDAKTYRPVRVSLIAGPLDAYRVGFPFLDVTFAGGISQMQFGPTTGPYALVCDFVEYRYLPRTASNRKLADIRAMHPHAPVL